MAVAVSLYLGIGIVSGLSDLKYDLPTALEYRTEFSVSMARREPDL